MWLRKTALPSVRLPQAVRASGPRRLEATPRDWRRWALFTGVVLLVGGAAMLTFLIGVLGRGGIAEGVVVGMLAAWGLATLEDARRIESIEAAEGRRYFAACRRPTGVGNRLVWLPRRARGGRPGLDVPLAVEVGEEALRLLRVQLGVAAAGAGLGADGADAPGGHRGPAAFQAHDPGENGELHRTLALRAGGGHGANIPPWVSTIG